MEFFIWIVIVISVFGMYCMSHIDNNKVRAFYIVSLGIFSLTSTWLLSSII